MTNAPQQQQVATRTQQSTAIGALRADLERMEEQFKFALPAHIPPARFTRVVMTAVQNNPKLLKCDRYSFFNACMKCAQDGLLPDGREAALVPYGDDPDSGQGKADIAQYLPMIAGIRKKVRNSGLLRDWNVQVVQQGDEFDYQLGDDPFIKHKPAARGGRTRPVLFAYSIATYPDGTKSREVMNIDQIKDIQSKSKAKRGPWSDQIFFPEMCRKTCAKLHAKQLPMSTDLDTILRRDEELYDFKGERERAALATKPPPSVGAALDMFAGEPEPAQDELSRPPATVSQPGEGGGGPQDPSGAAAPPPAAKAPAQAPAPPADDPLARARRQGYEARTAGHARKAIPGELRAPERSQEAQAFQAGWDEADGAGKAPGAPGGAAGGGALLVLVTLALLAFSSTSPRAEACVTSYRELPANHGWRHYRLIDGRACWYVEGSRRQAARAPRAPAGKTAFALAAAVPPKIAKPPIEPAGPVEQLAELRPPEQLLPIAFERRWVEPPPLVVTPPPAPAAIAISAAEPAGMVAAVAVAGFFFKLLKRRRDAARWRLPPILDLNDRAPGSLFGEAWA